MSIMQTGIVPLIFSPQVNTTLQLGDIQFDKHLCPVCQPVRRSHIGDFIDKVSVVEVSMKPLAEVLRIVTHETDPMVQKSLKKQQGYLARLFSKETWEEWSEYRTSLGKVVAVFESFLENGNSPQLSPQTIREAVSESSAVLNQAKYCGVDVILGSVASVYIGNPLPAIWASLSCITPVNSQRPVSQTRNQILSQRDQRRVDAGVAPVSLSSPQLALQTLADPAQVTKGKLLSELAKVLPDNIYNMIANSKGDNWVDVVLEGIVNVIVDISQISAPKKQLESALEKMEIDYWGDVVFPKYIKIFRAPNKAWDRNGKYDPFYEIQEMRNKLKSYGYHLGYGTPAEFLDYLIKLGVCEDGDECP